MIESFSVRGFQRAFTLIELLVVITIIVVLLSLLTPALDKALYQAKLVQCSGQFKAMSHGMSMYAVENRRSYPDRPIFTRDVPERIQMGEPYGTERGTTEARAQGEVVVDWRPVLEGYIRFEMFNDPLAESVDFSYEGTDFNTNVFSSQVFWVGFRWYYSGSEAKPMLRLGDQWTWKGRRFNYLFTDMARIDEPLNLVQHAHPDSLDVLAEVGGENRQTGSNPTYYRTAKYWWTRNTLMRGTVDTNAAGADGSVLRISNLTWDDERNWLVSHHGWHDTTQEGVYIGMQVPK